MWLWDYLAQGSLRLNMHTAHRGSAGNAAADPGQEWGLAEEHPLGQQRLASVCVCGGGCLLDIPWYFQIFWKERIAYFDRHGVASCWNKVAVDGARRLGHGTSPAWILSLEWGSRGIPGKLYKAFAPWGLVGMGWGEAV